LEINLTGKNTSVTEPLKAYADEKLGKLDRYFQDVMRIEVVLIVEDHRQIAECTVNIKRHDPLFAQAEGADLYAAIDMLTDKMERQLKKQKGKVEDARHKKTGLGRESAIMGGPTPAVGEEAGEPEEEE
jgi:putative sigma-54 modulation protein